jgi:hypothetical protein
MFERYFVLVNSYINSIGQSSKTAMMQEDAEWYNTGGKSLENLLTNENLHDDDDTGAMTQ